jgi:putative transposase
MFRAIKVRIYPNQEQAHRLILNMGCSRWWWNYALNYCNQTYKATGKGLTQVALNKLLPPLKKAEETQWLGECYSQILQSTTLNLTKAFKNFFEKRAKYPRFKSYHRKQSIQYPQYCQVVEDGVKLPQFGIVKAKIHRLFEGELKTVTISRTPSGKFYASLLFDTRLEYPSPIITGKVVGIDLGLTDFAITNDGEKTSKYPNPRQLSKHERNLARKQAKLARKKKGSNSRLKAKKLVAKVHEKISNARNDFLHKLSRKIVNDNQVVIVENLNIKGMVKNHKLAKAISDVGWGMFVNFLDYKLKLKGGLLVEIDRWFPSSKICSNCLDQIGEIPLDVREWDCPNCGTHHDRDGNASINIRAEGIRQISVLGTRTAARVGDARPKAGRKSPLEAIPN